jgi:hypothetical protein
MEESITIHYTPQISESIVQEFAQGLNIRQTRVVNTKNLEHFEDLGRAVSDISIFLSQHTTELLVGILGNLLTNGLVVLYHKLKSSTKKNPSIEVHLSGKGYRATFILRKDVSEKSIEICFNEFKELIQSEKPKQDAQNPTYNHSRSSKPSVQYFFDEDFQTWIPTNFSENARAIKTAKDEIGRWRN